jgi:hypothetical protein
MVVTNTDLPTVRMKYKGVFDLNTLLQNMQEWFPLQGYKFYEKQLKHKIPSPAGAEDEIEWYAIKNVTQYVRYQIDVFFHLWDLHDVQVVKDGQKQKLQWARMLIEIDGKVIYDWQNRFSSTPFNRFLQTLYHNFIIRGDMLFYYSDQLYYFTYKLQKVAKDNLALDTNANPSEGRW